MRAQEACRNVLTPCRLLRAAHMFFRDQLQSFTGHAHHAGERPPPTATQRLLMVCSSLTYLSCSWTWQHFEYPRLGSWFWLVAAASSVADGIADVLLEVLVERNELAS